jgi:hypothetical protein
MPVADEHLEVARSDGDWHRLTYQENASVLYDGRTTREWSTELYNAIALRDGGCRWFGCNAPVHWCDLHHITWWEHGGLTDIDSGVLLCRRHHHKFHSKHGGTLKLLPDGILEITTPDGTTEITVSRGLGYAHGPAPPEPEEP